MSKPQPKVGDVVLFTAFGRTVNAIVLSARSGEVSHLGKNGEPLLTVAFVDPDRERAIAPNKPRPGAQPPQTQMPQVFTEFDVVHFSHEFSAEFKAKHGSTPAQIAAQRGHGEWREAVVADATPVAEAPASDSSEPAE